MSVTHLGSAPITVTENGEHTVLTPSHAPWVHLSLVAAGVRELHDAIACVALMGEPHRVTSDGIEFGRDGDGYEIRVWGPPMPLTLGQATGLLDTLAKRLSVLAGGARG